MSWSAARRYKFRRTLLATAVISSSLGSLLVPASAPEPPLGRTLPPSPPTLEFTPVAAKEMRTRASWTNTRPKYCYDHPKGRPARRHRVPNVSLWTAARPETAACGTVLIVRAQGRPVRVAVWERGPYHRDGRGRYDRDLDLSKEAFRRLADPSVGVLRVQWRKA